MFSESPVFSYLSIHVFLNLFIFMNFQCYDNMGHAITTQDGLSIEFDEDVCCDVCQSVCIFVIVCTCPVQF